MDVTRFLTNIAKRRKSGILREWANKLMQNQSNISLANGMPNSRTFPFEEISVTYKNGTKIKLTGEELSWSLQYGPSQGYIPLLKKMRKLQECWYKPAYDNWDVLLTSGSMDGCCKVFEMVLEFGDPVMVQVPTYGGILNLLTPMLPEFIGIEQDENGIIPEHVTKICEQRIRDNKPMPKILYVNPTGANPTGTVLTDSRKRQIYQLAEKFNFLILEDDPYCFLHFVDERPTTFLQLDTNGRVIRLDSFSKILSPGLRLGVVTAHRELIKKLTMHMETTSIHASSLSQMLLYKWLSNWDLQNMQKHFNEIQQFYRERRDVMLLLIEKHLKGLAEWNVPKGGMFVWIKVNEIQDVMELTAEKCISQGILVLPGNAFNYDHSTPEQHIRLCYSYTSPEKIDKALLILAKLIREEIKQQRQSHN